MAALALSNYTLFSPRPSTSSKAIESTSLVTPSLCFLHNPRHRSRLCYSLLSFSPASHSSPVRRSFIPCFSAQDSVPNVNKEEDDGEDGNKAGDELHGLSLQALINVYREAFLDGDQKTISKVEAKLKNFEREKDGLFQKVSNTSAEITSGKENYIRLQADFDNFRKRSEKERLTVKNNAQKEVIENLLPMIDSFEKARQQIVPQTDKEKKIDVSYQGIYKQFVEVLRSWRISAVAAVGRPFDPSLHEAVAREESQEIKEGIIIQELRRGFLLGERLLRPARVKVSKGPGKKNSPTTNSDIPTEQPATATARLDEH
ncbi:uncharacterized protein LOC111797984 isoform X2 [Cucurbita pepo subsp. pepo]|uniref:uncharacterized protein LOC111797984 isoform X2 n=1 Tax=Cucurbita pepo subsp. pepo TaxID=3664 RepID=UPI000C9D3A59|nr:uncharacterized protein LOC111797984 isoform X2 [Cucurbita pepo subsp. pepo]